MTDYSWATRCEWSRACDGCPQCFGECVCVCVCERERGVGVRIRVRVSVRVKVRECPMRVE